MRAVATRCIARGAAQSACAASPAIGMSLHTGLTARCAAPFLNMLARVLLAIVDDGHVVAICLDPLNFFDRDELAEGVADTNVPTFVVGDHEFAHWFVKCRMLGTDL